jgi:hypothetical protein
MENNSIHLTQQSMIHISEFAVLIKTEPVFKRLHVTKWNDLVVIQTPSSHVSVYYTDAVCAAVIFTVLLCN